MNTIYWFGNFNFAISGFLIIVHLKLDHKEPSTV